MEKEKSNVSTSLKIPDIWQAFSKYTLDFYFSIIQ